MPAVGEKTLIVGCKGRMGAMLCSEALERGLAVAGIAWATGLLSPKKAPAPEDNDGYDFTSFTESCNKGSWNCSRSYAVFLTSSVHYWLNRRRFELLFAKD